MEINEGMDRRGLAAAGVTVLLWSSAFIAIRSAGQYFSPGSLALGRLLAGAVVLSAIMVLRREKWALPRAAWPGVAATGVLWFGVYMVMLNWAEQHVDAGTASMIVNIGPILIALLGGWVLKEGFPRRVLAGVAGAFAGAVVGGVGLSGGGSSSPVGELAGGLAAGGATRGRHPGPRLSPPSTDEPQVAARPSR